MIKVKICGITQIEDAILAAKLGAWAVGYIFYKNSKRYITPENASIISQKLKDYNIKKIGVFVNENPEIINKIALMANLDYVQLHGMESISDIKKINFPYIKNIRNSDEVNVYNNASYYLTDACDTKNWGGTGKLANWTFAKSIKNMNKPLILSGGLSVNNIEKSIKDVNPDVIDISSSIELDYGIKNQQAMKDLFDKIITMENKNDI